MKLKKLTDRTERTAGQRYDDACGTAHALELIGDRWAILIMRELMLGGRRFSSLRADLPGISANILTQRLGELEARGLVVRRRWPSPSPVQYYELTPWGYEAEPIIQSMGRWAARSPHHDPNLRISGVSALLSLRTMLDRDRARGIGALIGFRFGDDTYRGLLNADGFAIVRGELDEACLVFDGQPAALMAAVHGGVPIAKLKAAGTLTVIGDRDLAKRFFTLFPLPQKLPR